MIRILVHFPNKMGDSILMMPFLLNLKEEYPDSRIDGIMMKPFVEIAAFMPNLNHVYAFDKKKYSGVSGKRRFGREIKKKEKYDLYFCAPHSFSAAMIGYFTGSKKRIGFSNEMRGFLLTDTFSLPKGRVHATMDSIMLLNAFTGKNYRFKPVYYKDPLDLPFEMPEGKNLVFNVNSAGDSRRIPVDKSVYLINLLRSRYACNIILVGSPGERAHVDGICESLEDKTSVYNRTGKTSITELAAVLQHADMMLSTDSGTAHLCNILGTKLVVMFGAGSEWATGPMNKEKLRIIRKPGLECAPCRSSVCKLKEPLCLTEMEDERILNAIDELGF
jgi:heptosyltransferase-2